MTNAIALHDAFRKLVECGALWFIQSIVTAIIAPGHSEGTVLPLCSQRVLGVPHSIDWPWPSKTGDRNLNESNSSVRPDTIHNRFSMCTWTIVYCSTVH